MASDFTLRRATPADQHDLATICYDAFCGINDAHGFPHEFPNRDVAVGLMGLCLNSPTIYGVVAEQAGRVIGSNFLWEDGIIAGIGPITVDPAVQARSVGKALMLDVLARADERRFAGVRLCQSAFNTQSMSLYTKLGFDVREPLVVLNGTIATKTLPGHTVRPATGPAPSPG